MGFEVLDPIGGKKTSGFVEPTAPEAHADSHENGGSDEISVAGLSGVLADPQTPATHATSHKNGGGDEVAVAAAAANAIPKADANGFLAGEWVVSEVSVTSTGNIDDLNIGTAPFVLLRMNNATEATIRGMIPGTPRQRVMVVSVGAGHVFTAHQDTNEGTAARRIINWVTSGRTPLAAGSGVAMYQYDDTTDRWRLVAHEQGAWITPAFSAGDYTASGSMTWTVDSGDVSVNAYRVSGKTLTRAFGIITTTVGGTPSNELRSANPNGYTAAGRVFNGGVMNDNGTAANGYLDTKSAGNGYVGFFLNSGANWQAATNNTAALSSISFEIQ